MATEPKKEVRPRDRVEYRVVYRFLGSEEQAQRTRRQVVDCLRASLVPRRSVDPEEGVNRESHDR